MAGTIGLMVFAGLGSAVLGAGTFTVLRPWLPGAAAARGAQNYVTFETDFGPERTSYWHGVDFALNARLRQGLTFQFEQ